MEATLIRTFSKLSLFTLLLLAMTTSAFAQATRTWVSGVGDDANPCSRTAPCKTFAGAISKTASGGEISVLDPGGFGPVNITKPLTIDGTGQVSSILGSGTNGIIINTPGLDDHVMIRNISINGALETASPGVNGIRIIQGAFVSIEGCTIFGFNRGVFIDSGATNPKVVIRNSSVRDNNEGVNSTPTTGNVSLTIENSSVDSNTGHGVNLKLNTTMSAVNSTMSLNGASGLLAQASTTAAALERCTLNHNVQGIFAGLTGGAPAIRLSHCVIFGNSAQGVFLNGGVVTGFQSNMIVGNAGNNTINSTAPQ
jgi:hypothetical protein